MWTIEQTRIGRIVVPPYVPEGFAVFITTRDYPGRVVAEDLTSVVEERFGIESHLTTCNQIHSANVARAHDGQRWRECEACDALWSDEKRVSLGIKVADCLPITMIDAAHSVIANVHSGWRGAVQNITSETLDAMERATAFAATSAFAYLGPTIRVCCFEVGEEVASQFEARFVDRSHAKPHVDVAAMTIDLLRARGFEDERIFDAELCTRCEGSIFHSYRRDARSGGRNLAIVAQ